MGASTIRRWGVVLLVVGAFYFVAGFTLAALAGAASPRMRIAWRLTAWLVSAIAFVAHIGYEQSRLRHSPPVTALHASLAAALGAFALAAAATIRAASTGEGNLRLLAIALVAWPALTAVPAFLVALFAAAVLGRMRRRS